MENFRIVSVRRTYSEYSHTPTSKYQKKNMKRSLYVKECDKRNGTVGKSIRKQCGDAYA